MRACDIVVTRQQPQTAKGVVFVTLKDETGSGNIIVWKSLREKQHTPAGKPGHAEPQLSLNGLVHDFPDQGRGNRARRSRSTRSIWLRMYCWLASTRG